MERRPRSEPKLPPGTHPLLKFLVTAGLGARRHCVELIVNGHVRVNGIPADNLNHPVRARDRVDVDGMPVRPQPVERTYLLLNKPAGYLSTVRDDRGRRTVMDLVPEDQRVPGLVPAGRLDLDSTGLMLLTNDGDLVDLITHPRYGVEKEYRILIDRPLSPDGTRALLEGVDIEDGIARAKWVRRLTETDNQARYAVTLVEGKKREVRRMLMAVGRRVIELERTRLGNITLGQLPLAQTRRMSNAELRGLLAVADRRALSGRREATREPEEEAKQRHGPGPAYPKPEHGGRAPQRGGGAHPRERDAERTNGPPRRPGPPARGPKPAGRPTPPGPRRPTRSNPAGPSRPPRAPFRGRRSA